MAITDKTFHKALLLLYRTQKAEELPHYLLYALVTLYGEGLYASFWQGFLGEPFRSYYWPEKAVCKETETILFHYAHEHPTYNKRRQQPVALSDVISQEKWETTQLFQRFYQPHDIQDNLGLDIDLEKGCLLSLDLGRIGRRGFTPLEKQTLAFLAAHLQQIHQRLLSARTYCPGGGWIFLDTKGNLQTKGSSAARDLLARYLGAAAVQKGKCPPCLDDWLKELPLEKKGKPPVFQKQGKSGLLIVTAHFSPLPGGNTYLLVREEASGSPAPLSGREKEILAWLTESKTNQEIACLLNIREGTVKRHLENIYGKLGVENRQAAALHALRQGISPQR